MPFAPRILSLTHSEHPVGNHAGVELLYEGPAFKRPTLITLVFGNADAYRASLAGWADDRRVQVSGAVIEALIAQVSAAPIGATIH